MYKVEPSVMWTKLSVEYRLVITVWIMLQQTLNKILAEGHNQKTSIFLSQVESHLNSICPFFFVALATQKARS